MDPRERVLAINAARLNDIEQEKALLDSIKPGDTRTAEQVEQLERIQAAIADKDAQVRDLVQREQREREAADIRDNMNRLYGEDAVNRREARDIDSFRAWYEAPADKRGDYEINLQAAAKERQMLRQGYSAAEIRNALLTDTGSIASAVPTTMARALYEYMEASIAAFRLGAEQINTATGETMEFPKVAAHGIATQVSGQGTVIAGTDPTFDKITLVPNRYGQIVVVSSDAVSDPVFDVGSFLGRNIGRAIGRLVDGHLILGTGGITGGIMSSAMTGAAGTVGLGGTLATDYLTNVTKFIDMVYGVNDEYRQRAKWLMRDATAGALRKVRDGAGGTLGAFLWEPSLTNGLVNGEPDRFLGFPVITDPNVASMASNARIAAFGDFSAYYLRTVGNVQLDASTERYFDTDQVGFRGKWRVDGAYIDDTAVVLLKNSVS